MKTALILILAVALTGCAHVASMRATFSRPPDDHVFVLRLARHVDTIVRGPDSEEDQILELELRSAEIGKRLAIPSEEATARFSVQRFGPASTGDRYRGYVILRSVSEKEAVATVRLEVTAHTADNSYRQTAWFRGTYTFERQ